MWLRRHRRCRVDGDGTLTVDWSGDRGFAHRERVEIVVAT
jgi:hypothetical protein